MLLTMRLRSSYFKKILSHRQVNRFAPLTGKAVIVNHTSVRSFSVVKDFPSPLLSEFYDEVQNGRVSNALSLYAQLKASIQPLQMDVHSAVLNLLNGATHLAEAEDIFKYAVAKQGSVRDQMYLGMIKCYCQAGRHEDAYKLLQGCLHTSTIPRLRFYQPLIECVCMIKKDPIVALSYVEEMKAMQIQPTSDILTLILIASQKSGMLCDEEFARRINDFVIEYSEQSLGVSAEDARKLVCAYMNQSTSEVREQGVLVHNQDAIKGEIIQVTEDANSSELRVLAVSDSYIDPNRPTKYSMLSAMKSSKCLLFGSNVPKDCSDNAYFECEVENFVVRKDASTTSTEESAVTDSTLLTTSTSTSSTTPSSPSSSTTRIRSMAPVIATARIVDIDHSSCLCPNCAQSVKPMRLTPSEIVATREAIASYMTTLEDISSTSPSRSEIESTKKWMDQNGPYRYIIDGANVAYSGGRQKGHMQFTVNQIKVLLAKLAQPQYPPGRPLVVLPRSHVNYFLNPKFRSSRAPRMPFHIRPGTAGEMNEYEIAKFMRQMYQKKILFAVPKGFPDDLYWVYASLNGGNRKHSKKHTTRTGSNSAMKSTTTTSTTTTTTTTNTNSSSHSTHLSPTGPPSSTTTQSKEKSSDTDDLIYVISNDDTIDHRNIFPSERAFVRWRASQMVHFDMPPKSNFNEARPLLTDDILLSFPGNYSREVQRAESPGVTDSGNTRWHIPIYDKQAWLCIDVTASTTNPVSP